MGAPSREIERQIKETRERIDENLNQLEGRAASNAVRFGRIAAAVVGGIVIGGAAFLIYRRVRKTMRGDRRSAKVRVEKRTAHEPGAFESIVRSVAPALVATASTALIERMARSRDKTAGRSAPPRAP